MHDTDTPTTTTGQVDDDKDHRLLYASDRLTLPMALAAITGQEQGLLTFEDLPWQMPDGLEFLAAVHKVLDERGALAAHAARVQMAARVAQCPWWCHGKHPTVFDSDQVLVHRLPVAKLEVIGPYGRETTVEVAVAVAQEAEGVTERPTVVIETNLPDELTADDARAVGQAFIAAGELLDEIERTAR